jgi:hypothetical protein
MKIFFFDHNMEADFLDTHNCSNAEIKVYAPDSAHVPPTLGANFNLELGSLEGRNFERGITIWIVHGDSDLSQGNKVDALCENLKCLAEKQSHVFYLFASRGDPAQMAAIQYGDAARKFFYTYPDRLLDMTRLRDALASREAMRASGDPLITTLASILAINDEGANLPLAIEMVSELLASFRQTPDENLLAERDLALRLLNAALASKTMGSNDRQLLTTFKNKFEIEHHAAGHE